MNETVIKGYYNVIFYKFTLNVDIIQCLEKKKG